MREAGVLVAALGCIQTGIAIKSNRDAMRAHNEVIVVKLWVLIVLGKN